MGAHDQMVLHDEDAHEYIGDDGRSLVQVELGAGAGANDPEGPDIYKNTPVLRYARDKLIPETIHLRKSSFSVTKWEAVFSTVFGSGTRPDWVSPSADPGLEPSFTPIVDEHYRVVGHLGWIGGPEVCVPQNTIAWDSPVARIYEKHRLADARQSFLDDADRYDRGPYTNPFHAVTPSSPPVRTPVPCVPPAPTIKPTPTIWEEARRGPFQSESSQETRLLNNINYFIAGGGTAVIGRQYVHDQMANQKFEPFLPGDFKCMALIRPDGYVQSVLRVAKIHHESRNERVFRIAFEVIDIALTVWMVIDLFTLPIALIRAGLWVAERIEIWAIEMAADRAAKAALKLAEQEAKVALELAEKAAREFAVETVVIPAETEARWAERGAKLRLPEPPKPPKIDRQTNAVGELWRDGAAKSEGYAGRSGKDAKLAKTDLTQPPRQVIKPEPIEGLNKGIPEHLKDASPAEKTKWLQSKEGWEWQKTHRLDGPSNTLDTTAPHAGPRDHDAEANMFERLKAKTSPDTAGEFHFKVDHPLCPACKDMLFRFSKQRPKIKVIQHSLDNKLITP